MAYGEDNSDCLARNLGGGATQSLPSPPPFVERLSNVEGYLGKVDQEKQDQLREAFHRITYIEKALGIAAPPLVEQAAARQRFVG